MKNTFLLYFSSIMIVGIVACNGEKSTVEIGESNQTVQQDTSELEALKKAALSFHTWYMAAVDDPHNSNWAVAIKEDGNGYCAFDFYDYFDALRKLGTISEKFIERERQRLRSCEEFMKTVKYEDYLSSEAYDYQDDCGSFYYMYWIRSQEPFSGVEVDKVLKTNGIQQVKLVFYNDFQGKKEYVRSHQPIITLTRENTAWKIAKIDWSQQKLNHGNK